MAFTRQHMQEKSAILSLEQRGKVISQFLRLLPFLQCFSLSGHYVTSQKILDAPFSFLWYSDTICRHLIPFGIIWFWRWRYTP